MSGQQSDDPPSSPSSGADFPAVGQYDLVPGPGEEGYVAPGEEIESLDDLDDLDTDDGDASMSLDEIDDGPADDLTLEDPASPE